MTYILELEIKNYRGISSFSSRLDRDIVCLVGRGDSSKTTILEAIKASLSPQWNYNFYDTDFFQLNTDTPITIEISLADVPDVLLSEKKYGLHVRGLCKKTNTIVDDLNEEETPVLTIKLQVDKSLEPKWLVTTKREIDDKPISAGDRSKLACFMVSDYVDSHFSWNQGNPLYSLQKSFGENNIQEKTLLDIVRETKAKVDELNFSHFDNVTQTIQKQAASIGLNLDNAQTTIDFREINIKESRVSLHDGDIPFRLMGKGSKRLASIAIQTAVAHNGGVALIDEIEQGLEPDRIRQVARTLKAENRGQLILTTHSRDMICELKAQDLLVINRNKYNGEVLSEFLDLDGNQLQGVVRACPEAFFATKVIVCEGATEIGICRALDHYRSSCNLEPLSFKGCAYVDGTGNSFSDRALQIAKSGILVSVLCDSDVDDKLTPTKQELLDNDISIYDCEHGLSLEEQVFKDLPWTAIVELLSYVEHTHNICPKSLKDSISARYYDKHNFPENWLEEDTAEMRAAIGSSAKKKEWFKRIDHGQSLGEVVFKHFDDIKGTNTHDCLMGVIGWVDE